MYLDDVEEGFEGLLEAGLTAEGENVDEVLGTLLHLGIHPRGVEAPPLEEALEDVDIPRSILQQSHVHGERIALPKQLPHTSCRTVKKNYDAHGECSRMVSGGRSH